MDLVRIDQKDLGKVIPLTELHIRKSLDYSLDITYEEVIKGLYSDTHTLWVLINREKVGEVFGCVITGFLIQPENTVLEIVTGGAVSGHREEWMEHLDTLTNYARGMGATRLEFEGRPGWEKIMRPEGFKVEKIRMQKEV